MTEDSKVHVNYTSVPAASSNVILGTDIYTYEGGSATYSETALPSTSITSAAPRRRIKPSLGVVLAHPYPPLGGSKSDRVVRFLAHKLVQKLRTEVVVYAFNFRGVTTRTSWTSRKEQADVVAVASSLLDSFSSVKTLLFTGYSYGAIICAKADLDSLRESSGVNITYWLLSPPLWPISGALTLGLRSTNSDPQLAKLTNAYQKGSVDSKILVSYGTKDTFTRSHKYEKWANQQLELIKQRHPEFPPPDSPDSPVKFVEIQEGSHFLNLNHMEELWTNQTTVDFINSLVDRNSDDSDSGKSIVV
ncbi:hypothetical protein POJ06DRAFT_245567 [Lipomyces tetrasporus]|uniref:AB hydrolase-1 domain-containing protein n=1 Tax=Lipomyces tetrasporus TaxID=54092 RepID=A0AAD7QWI0_9ASCO|nr:uncharacterized protein POJ06DRAFT_245567 [Lipomyces tetrasporus]KAJ8102763.1 hypothetical protein POJ06DRAFT_245567 [Lipomyces tetrasporus]